jgi:hypothetical protein
LGRGGERFDAAFQSVALVAANRYGGKFQNAGGAGSIPGIAIRVLDHNPNVLIRQIIGLITKVLRKWQSLQRRRTQHLQPSIKGLLWGRGGSLRTAKLAKSVEKIRQQSCAIPFLRTQRESEICVPHCENV